MMYESIEGCTDFFEVELDSMNRMTSVRNRSDRYRMNWIQGKVPWGTIKTKQELTVTIFRKFTERGTLSESYCFRNDTQFDIYTLGTDLGIYTPFTDYYDSAEVCMTQCCNTHLWCHGSSSYIMALRMGGEAPHLGMVVTEGSLQGYSVERMEMTEGVEEELSNQRGDFILHPENLCLSPGECYSLSWELFWFEDKEDFKRCLLRQTDFISIEAQRFIIFQGEEIMFHAFIGQPENDRKGNQEKTEEKPRVVRNGVEVEAVWKAGMLSVRECPGESGEYLYAVMLHGKTSYALFRVLPILEELAYRRCAFIAKHQQCHRAGSHLNGAYLIYDNEECSQYYHHRNDYNGGRERVGMGVLLACYLQRCPNAFLEQSLENYVSYVLRELYDERTGEVFNDMPRCRDYIRLYNYPWMSRLFLEMYHLKGDEVFLDRYSKSVKAFYEAGGRRYYAIGMPMEESIHTFREAGRSTEAEQLLSLYKEQGEFILRCGKNYPAHEVKYEQSIVAPAAICLSELYRLTGEEKYRCGAAEQLKILDLFQGFQPDYHMNEVAIRHWDGYWFGKSRCLGDTFPHYWSALSGYAFSDSEEIMGNVVLSEKSDRTRRGVLSLFREDGSASCAMVYPMSVNGRRAAFYDAWANDQDWGLYFYLKKIF